MRKSAAAATDGEPASHAASALATELTLDELLRAQPAAGTRRVYDANESFKAGDLRSRRRGTGMELDSVGPYQAGDDIRHIDWLASARTGRPQSRRFHAEVQRSVIPVVDLRRHMLFGTDQQLMAKTACLAAAQLARTVAVNQQLLGWALVSDSGTRLLPLARGRRARLRQLQAVVEHYSHAVTLKTQSSVQSPAGVPSTLDQAIEWLGENTARDAELFIFSDFSDPGEDFEQQIATLARGRLHAVLIQDAMMASAPVAGQFPVVQAVRQRGSTGENQTDIARYTIDRTAREKYAVCARDDQRQLISLLAGCGVRDIQLTDVESLAANR